MPQENHQVYRVDRLAKASDHGNHTKADIGTAQILWFGGCYKTIQPMPEWKQTLKVDDDSANDNADNYQLY